MKRWAFLALAAGLMLAGRHTDARAADLALFGRLPAIEAVAISADGKCLAEIRTEGDNRQVVVVDLDGNKMLGELNAGAGKVRAVQWVDGDNLLITTSYATRISDVIGGTGEYSTGVLYNVRTKVQRPILNDMPGQGLNVIYGRPSIRPDEDGKPAIYGIALTFHDDGGLLSLFEVPLHGRTKIVVNGDESTDDFLTTPDGRVQAQNEFDDRSGQWSLRLRGPNGVRTVTLPDGMTKPPNVLGLSADGVSTIISYEKGGQLIAAEVSPDNVWKTLSEDADTNRPVFDPATDRMIGMTGVKDGDTVLTFSDPADQQMWGKVGGAFKGQFVDFVGFSADHKRWVVRADSPQTGVVYSLVDFATGKASIIGEEYAGLKDGDLGAKQPISFKAADGTSLTGYLTLPPKAAAGAKGLPLVVLPHGGPAARDLPGFDWWAQAIASRGYAVLQVEFRGSDGFGLDFMQSGFGQWGRKMQTDLSDGVHDLAAKGTIDAKRVCIFGGSYGGYAALAGAAFDKGVYRCAVSLAGPADLRKMLTSTRANDSREDLRWWDKFMGVTNANDPKLAEISPIEHVADITIPVMLLHGTDDTVVKYEQSQLMADALKKAGKTYEFVTLDKEDHWMTHGATRQQMLASAMAFIEKYNPAD